MTEIIDEDTFDERFKPIESPGQECGSHLWEHHEVKAALDAKTITDKQVWTFVDADDGYAIQPGMAIVNKIEYMVTEVPWEHEDICVEIPENDEEDGAPCCPDPTGCQPGACTFPGYAANH